MTKQMSTLRRHMIEDMKIRNMSPNSQKVYTYAVANFAAFHGKSPDKLGIEDFREYRLHLMARGLKATSINPIIGALRFFYGTTLRRKEMMEQIPYARREDTLPAVLTPDEILLEPTVAAQGHPGGPPDESSMQEFERLIDVLKQAREDLAQGQRDGLPPDEMLARHERAYRAWQAAETYQRETGCSPDRVL
jgi:hypothetical protein